MLRGVLKYLGLIRDADASDVRTPAGTALRRVDVLASVAYLAVALHIANTIDRAYRATESITCAGVAAFDVVLASLPVLCLVGIATTIAHFALTQERAQLPLY
jgi:hypothetical protein